MKAVSIFLLGALSFATLLLMVMQEGSEIILPNLVFRSKK